MSFEYHVARVAVNGVNGSDVASLLTLVVSEWLEEYQRRRRERRRDREAYGVGAAEKRAEREGGEEMAVTHGA